MVLSSSQHGAELLEEIKVTEEVENSNLQSSANGENVQPTGVSSTSVGVSGNVSGTNGQISGTITTKNNNTAVDGVIDESQVIDLSNDNELSQLLGDTTGAPKYAKIRDCALGLLGGQKITLSDGKNAIVDKSDALHIANKAASKKIAQISKIKEIIEKAELYAEDNNVEHNKFNYFCYYRAFVRVGKDIVPVYLNVGKGINDGKYHVYDITNKIRDTAHRINGVERPKPNEGYALQTVSHDYTVPQDGTGVKNNISDSGENYTDLLENDSDNDSGGSNINSSNDGDSSTGDENSSSDENSSTNDSGELHQDGNIVTFGGIDTEKGKHLDKAQQDEIVDIGKKLNQEVVFEDFYKLEKFKGKKKVPDGFLGADGKVHINYYAKRPVQFLLKHEITHYLKRKLSDFAYQDFLGFVLKSKAFTNWMHSKGFSSMTDLKKDVYDRYIEVKNFNEEKCYDEILADFVGDYLFGGENAVSQKLINALSPKQKKTFMETIKDIIAHIKQKFSEKARLQQEIIDLEDRFLQLCNEAVATPVKENSNMQDEFAIEGKNANTANHSKLIDAIRRVTSGEDSESVRQATGWYKGPGGKWRFYIPDNELNADKLVEPNFSSGKLGDIIVHDKLFAAYPQLKNLDIRLDDLPKRKRGKYLSDSKEIVLNNTLRNDVEKIKDTLVHEIQHAIQEIEGFASGGNKSVGLVVALNWAYEKVKDSQEFKKLDNRFAKRKYMIFTALKGLNAKSIQELQNNIYRAIYGEVEARDVTAKRILNEEGLKTSVPDTNGLVIDINDETTKFVENFTEMGYTEEEILNFFKGEQNDISSSNRNFEGRDSDIEGKSERGYGKSYIGSSIGRTGPSDGRIEGKSATDRPRISSGVHERSDTGRLVRGIGELNSQDSEDYSIPALTNPEELLEAYENGESEYVIEDFNKMDIHFLHKHLIYIKRGVKNESNYKTDRI